MLADVKRLRFDIIVCRRSGRLEAVMDAIDMKTFGLMAAANVGSNHTRPRRLSPSPPPTSTAVFRVDCLSSMLIRSNILTEGNIRNLVNVVDEQMDDVAGDERKRLETIESELADVRGRLGRLYDLVETTTEFNMADFAHRIRDHKERQERLESAAEGARANLAQRRAVLDDVKTITAYAQDMSRFLQKSELTERRAFIETFVKEIEVLPDNAVVRYTIPISQSTPKTQLLLGGRSEELWVSNEAEASSQLVWDVERRLSPAGNWHHTIIMDGSGP